MSDLPTPPAGVTARPSPLAHRGCVGEWTVPAEPYEGLRILLFETADGRHLELTGHVANARPIARHPAQARAWAFALLRAADWVEADPRRPTAPDPQLSLYDLMEAS